MTNYSQPVISYMKRHVILLSQYSGQGKMLENKITSIPRPPPLGTFNLGKWPGNICHMQWSILMSCGRHVVVWR